MRVERVVTSGIFSLDGEDFEVDNNIWLVGDDEAVVVIDAAHSAEVIAGAVGDRRVELIVCTHGHNDHINAAAELAERVGAPIAIHPADAELWAAVYPDRAPDQELADGATVDVPGGSLTVLHTPGHSPGGVSLHAAALRTVFSGDTLFNGGPGATGRSFSDRPTLLRSIEEKLFSLPDETVVHTGHGDSTTIGAERAIWDTTSAP
ncbi:MAG: beta-lactamase domain protein [Acidimicrobiales bacterium]|nr:beta-lactamase domain protein [Acidimicrobiales bacterium]